MPSYDFRCKECGNEFTEFYKSYSDYDHATPTCPRCHATDLARVINRVTTGSGVKQHDYTKMDANEMVGVFESGNSRDVNEMFSQIRGTNPADAKPYHDMTQQMQSNDSSNDKKPSSD